MSKGARMTVDEAVETLTEIAREGEGAERFRALKMVMGLESASASLPAPLTDSEIIDRLARLMRAAGPSAAQIAYRQAYPASKKTLEQAAPKLRESDVPAVDPLSLPRSLKALYRMFPEIKGPGVPRGYPLNRGLQEKQLWCQREARKMLLDKEQRRTVPEKVAKPEVPEPVDA